MFYGRPVCDGRLPREPQCHMLRLPDLHSTETAVSTWSKAKAQDIPQTVSGAVCRKGETIETRGTASDARIWCLGPHRRGIKRHLLYGHQACRRSSQNMPQEHDLFICEGMYGEKEKADKGQGIQAHDLSGGGGAWPKGAQPRQMWLTHYSPSLIRPEEYMEEVRSIFPRALAARDGWTLELGFDED